MTSPSATFIANLESFLDGDDPSLAGVLRKVGNVHVAPPNGINPSFFRLVMMGFATYDYHAHPDLWVETSPTSRVEFIKGWATWAFEAEIQAALDDQAEPDFSKLQGIVQQFQERQIPFFSSYMVDYFESA
jgi:hypothetical protein